MDGSYLTFSNERALKAAQILAASKVVAVHEDSWAHFSQNARQIRELFDVAGLGGAITAPEPGESVGLAL
ncbi:hypothetical protein [Saccharopolyspora spinosa]|uniref:hypothetical protein n=1 Tax=Saccharopolyspora spinosa TaxID=60894 RepID=UPI0002EA31BB|nr:hypothetical protein [Saccharopolyspora spinosa]